MRVPAILATTATLLAVAGCGTGTGTGSTVPGPAGASTAARVGPVTVFAAASLTESFTRIGRDVEAIRPGSPVTFNFGGSSARAAQINQGAPADVFASAAPKNMADVKDAVSPATFVKNQLVIAVPKGNARGVIGLADLGKAENKVALCAQQVPCGAAATTALAEAGVKITPVTMEQDVKAALSKVKLGEVDAALVYRTDAIAAAADVDAIEFPESAKAVNEYPIAVLKNSPNPAGAQAFADFVRSAKGQATLAAAGFQTP